MAPSSSSVPNGPREFTTPRKDRDRERQPQYSQPSPAPMKPSGSSSTIHSHSTSTSSVSSNNLAAPTPQITVEALLRQHASTPDPKGAALDQVVNERNTLSSQNAQLWKLVEKQRAGYNTILKEFERIRGERDTWKSRALGSSEGGDKGSSSRSDRTPKLSTSELPGTVKLAGKVNGTSRSNSSDEYLGARAPSSLQPSRSFDPIASRNDTSLHSNAAHTPSTPSRSYSPPPAPPSSAPSALATPNASRTAQRQAPSPLVISARYDNHVQVPGSNLVDSSGRQVQASEDTPVPHAPSANPYLNGARAAGVPPRKSSVTEYPPVSSVPITNPHGSANLAAPTAFNTPPSSQAPAAIESQKGDQYSEPPPSTYPRSLAPNTASASASIAQTNGNLRTAPQITTTSAAPRESPVPLSPTEPQMLSAIDARSPYLSRDSRITLPEEARHYITHMVDSPVVSPRVTDFPSPPTVLQTPSLKETTSKGEFLELDDDDDEGEESEGGGTDTIESESRPSLQVQEPTTPTNAQFSRSGDPAPVATPSRLRKEKTRASEDFPLSPPTTLHPQRQDSQQLSLPEDVSPSDASNSTDQLPPNIAHQSQESLNSGRSYNNALQAGRPSSFSDMRLPTPSAQALSAAFRALPLLSSDLPYTTVTVSHSLVRPNDRGKEVLSFIVAVSPGSGKASWKVEKTYSDVLNLDQRVRGSVGKGVGKKIVNLPEGKLWKDHAPARVDQRKAVLEQYLQSLIQLPIKRNDEVIAFFTSDIVRETKQPVMQVGHKEGYLTKRGKNFGGWKTRFFVLQGPVLEYYDCRGGQHLGSIQITGAQIARQHRTDRTSTTDEEKEYRHAFLIVEAKKGPGGNHPRHVLCAESDEERDDWVELLVRYYTGTYNEELVFNQNPGLNPANSTSVAANQYQSTPSQPRSSTSSGDITYSTPSRKQPSRPSLATEDYTRSSSPSRSVDPSPIDRQGPTGAMYEAQMRRTATERAAAATGLPSSLPDPSPLSSVPALQDPSRIERANSELGHYPDLTTEPLRSAQPRQHSPERHRPRDVYEGRQPNYSSSNLTVASANPLDRAPSPDKPADSNPRVKISAPMGGAPIPSGFKFGGGSKDASSDGGSSAERREKAKSRSFWGFGKPGGGGDRSHPAMVPRAVFAVPLAESLDVAQLCGLPAIVFRSIEYLENKKADQEEGIYRLNGSSAVIKGLRDRFNSEGDVDLLATEEYLDPHAVAGLLKSFLRDLPDSILTRELHLRFLAVIDLTDAQERIRELSQLIAALPIANYTLLRALTAHLILIVQNAGVNKMTMRNVGIVFSPTLGIPAGVFSLMLGEFNRVFNVDMDDEGSARPPEAGQPDSAEPLRRNSRQYTDNAADQFLGLTGRSLHSNSTAEDTQSQSSGDDFSVQDESGTENTDGEPTLDSSASSSPAQEGSQQEHDIRISPPDTPVATKTSRASNVAASKGLNLTVTGAERGNRHSRLMGLPMSPRPTQSPSKTSDFSS